MIIFDIMLISACQPIDITNINYPRNWSTQYEDDAAHNH